MANLVAGGMKSLGQAMEVDGYDSSKIHNVYDQVQNHVLKLGKSCSTIRSKDVKADETVFSVLDMPLDTRSQTRTTHMVRYHQRV